MSEPEIIEGDVDFDYPSAGKQLKTWYKTVGDFKTSTQGPLVVLHGGPGIPHNYLLTLMDLTTQYGIPVVFYDQVGGGKSTRLPEKMGDEQFWTETLFLAELDNLLKHLNIQDNYSVIGHSWGGALAAVHAAHHPKGLKRLLLQSPLFSTQLWIQEVTKLRKALPQDVQEKLDRHERDGSTDSQEYQEAISIFYHKHVFRCEQWPADVMASFSALEADPTVYYTMWGPSEMFATGNLKYWTIKDRVGLIETPTLLLNGRYDEATDGTMTQWFNHLGKAKWVEFAEASHFQHHEERVRFMKVVAEFLHWETSRV